MNQFKLTKGNSIILDLIRGVSAQFVVIGHGIAFFGILDIFHQPNFPWVQNIAVLIFFILSGFLISYSTFRKKNYSFKQFFIDRFSRIYSAFIPSLLFVFLLDFLYKYLNPSKEYFDSAFNLKTFLGNIFMLQDHPVGVVVSFVPHITSFSSARPFWTLAVEWWIYLFFGFWFLVIIKQKNNLKMFICLIFLSIVPIFNFINGRGNGLTLYWLFGLLVFYLLNKEVLKDLNKKLKFLLLFVMILLAVVRVGNTLKEYEPIFAFSLSIILLLVIDIFKNINFKESTHKVIKFLASYSYTLYLIHYSIMSFIYSSYYNTINPYYLFMISFILSNVLSFIIGYYTEIKLTKLIKSKMYAKFLNK